MADSFQETRRLLIESRRKLLTHANVVATGVGYKVTKGKRTPNLSIVCSVTKKIDLAKLAARERIPAAIDGIPTDVVETGVLRAWQSRTARHRPAPGGVSIGHRQITAGTLGCLVKRGGQICILSNNHVLANSNDANPGDPILQPGPHDGGKYPDDQIAELTAFVPVQFEGSPSPCKFAAGTIALLNAGCRAIGSRTRYQAVRLQAQDNLVDAAIARPFAAADVSDEILEIGKIRGTARGELGLAVKKSGRTTGLTQGEILQVDVTANVEYGPGRLARFTDQLLAGPMSQGGDSGSAVLTTDNRLVGLLFAGSDSSTIINRIEHVFAALDVSL
jgi:hypothetical protein